MARVSHRLRHLANHISQAVLVLNGVRAMFNYTGVKDVEAELVGIERDMWEEYLHVPLCARPYNVRGVRLTLFHW